MRQLHTFEPVIASKIDVKDDGHDKKYGLELIWLDTDWCKSWVHERIRWPGDKPGAWHLPGNTGEDYCRQIVSEARVRKPSGRPQWVQRASSLVTSLLSGCIFTPSSARYFIPLA